jgi:hypothetical protein
VFPTLSIKGVFTATVMQVLMLTMCLASMTIQLKQLYFQDTTASSYQFLTLATCLEEFLEDMSLFGITVLEGAPQMTRGRNVNVLWFQMSHNSQSPFIPLNSIEVKTIV